MGKYELQILDNYNNRTYSNGQAGSIYKQTPPTVNVCRPPGEWQTYDVIFIAPRFYSDGRVQSPAHITVLQNGVLVQNNTTIWEPNTRGVPEYKARIKRTHFLTGSWKSHGFQNIWIRISDRFAIRIADTVTDLRTI
jgi:hypothetical protein